METPLIQQIDLHLIVFDRLGFSIPRQKKIKISICFRMHIIVFEVFFDPQSAAEKAVSVIGSTLIELGGTLTQDLVVPGGVVVPNVSPGIKCDKGERTRFHSDVLSFNQMSEQCNQELSLSGKIPSGVFNSMFGYKGCWQKDAPATKNLAFDGWIISLYNIELAKTQIALSKKVKQEVPSSWDHAALADFIDKYGDLQVVGIPVTLNGDLKNQFVEANVGFDTVCKVDSQLISNLCIDAISAEKYYCFVRLMGQKSSHLALECTLQSHPNMVILGEEVVASKLTIFDITKQICDMPCKPGQKKVCMIYGLKPRYMFSLSMAYFCDQCDQLSVQAFADALLCCWLISITELL